MHFPESFNNKYSSLKNSININIYNEIQDYNFQNGTPSDSPHGTYADRLLSLAYGVLQEEGVIEAAPGPLHLAIWIVDDYYIAELNEKFMDHVGPTDVLSFPVDGRPPNTYRHVYYPDPPATSPATSPANGLLFLPKPSSYDDVVPWVLGDIFICPHQAELNAIEHDLEKNDEIALLLVHGILHILGMDHELDAEAEVMEALEQELLDKFWYTHQTPPHQTPPHQT